MEKWAWNMETCTNICENISSEIHLVTNASSVSSVEHRLYFLHVFHSGSEVDECVLKGYRKPWANILDII